MSESVSGSDVYNGAIALDSDMPVPDIYLFPVLIIVNYVNIRDIGKRLLFFSSKGQELSFVFMIIEMKFICS